jgi:hypothetical protein
MTPATRSAKPTDGALRAAKEIERNPSFIESTAEVIDRETGVRELVEILENIVAEAISHASPTASSNLLENGALLGNKGTFSRFTPQSGHFTR